VNGEDWSVLAVVVCVCRFNVLLGSFDFVTLCYNFFVCVCSTEIGKLDFCVDKNAALFHEKKEAFSLFLIMWQLMAAMCLVQNADIN